MRRLLRLSSFQLSLKVESIEGQEKSSERPDLLQFLKVLLLGVQVGIPKINIKKWEGARTHANTASKRLAPHPLGD